MSEFKINQMNNFMRIFRLPTDFPSDYCFSGGHPVEFQLVDWFNPIEPDTLKKVDLSKHREMIREFVRGKVYFDPSVKYLAIADYGDAFLI